MVIERPSGVFSSLYAPTVLQGFNQFSPVGRAEPSDRRAGGSTSGVAVEGASGFSPTSSVRRSTFGGLAMASVWWHAGLSSRFKRSAFGIVGPSRFVRAPLCSGAMLAPVGRAISRSRLDLASSSFCSSLMSAPFKRFHLQLLGRPPVRGSFAPASAKSWNRSRGGGGPDHPAPLSTAVSAFAHPVFAGVLVLSPLFFPACAGRRWETATCVLTWRYWFLHVKNHLLDHLFRIFRAIDHVIDVRAKSKCLLVLKVP